MIKKYFGPRLASLLLLATLSSTLLTQGAFAKISLKAFKGVTNCFNPGKAFFSPTSGEVALESHLIENYRFYGNWDMVKIFFPSPAGQLNAESSREANFGNNVDKVETIAILLNYANALREGSNIDSPTLKDSIFASLKRRPPIDTRVEEKKLSSLKAALLDITELKMGERISKIKEILKDEPDRGLKAAINTVNSVSGKLLTVDALQDVKQKMADAVDTYFNKKIQNKYEKKEARFKNNFLKETLDPLLQSIQDAIKGEKDSLYPEHTTEQIILSFFCYKFNTQQDIIDLLQNLDDSIVNKSKIPQIAELIEDDLTTISSHPTYDMDDILALETTDIWGPLLPYRDGSAPVSNGRTFQYDRTNNTRLELQKTFPDCAEVAARHLLNLLLYDKDAKDWDLSHIKSHISTNAPGNKYFHNLEEFYKTQHPNLANSGDIEMRSLWNTVVGNLNAYGEGANIAYVLNNNTNELETGFINLIRVFEKIFSLPLNPFPVLIAGKANENLEAKRAWLQDSFEKLFTVMNPTKTYRMDLSKLIETQDEISGDLPITVRDKKTKKDLFSFTFYSMYRDHSEVYHLRTLQKQNVKDYTKELKTHSTSIPENTAEEAVWMLSSNTELRNQKLRHPLHCLFNQQLEDNDSKIGALSRINKNFKTWKTEFSPEKLTIFKGILGNILKDISWDDKAVVKKAYIQVHMLLLKAELAETVSHFVKGVEGSYSFEDIKEKAKKFPNLEYIYFSGTADVISFSPDFKNLKGLNLIGSKVSNVEGLEHLTNLESLDLSHIDSLRGPFQIKDLDHLKTIRLNNTTISEGGLLLENLINLQNINIDNRQNRGEEGIKTLFLKDLPSLEFLNCRCHNLGEIVVEGNTSKLREINLSGTNIQQVDWIQNLSALEGLSISYARELRGPLILNDLENLKSLNVNNSSMGEILGLNTLLSLEDLNLSNMPNFQSLFLNNLLNLKNLTLEESSFKKIDLQSLPNLEKLNMACAKELEEIYLKDLENLNTITFNFFRTGNLKKLYLDNLNISNLDDFVKPIEPDNWYSSSNLQVQEIDIRNCEKITNVNLFRIEINKLNLENLSNLKMFMLYASKVERLSFKNLKNLENLDLRSLSNLKKVTFEGDFSSLKTLTLANSSALEEIEGLELLGGLKALDLSGTKKLQSITLGEKKQDLKLDIRNSKLTRGSIQGIDHLDESNIRG